jgi:hypothetical protein
VQFGKLHNSQECSIVARSMTPSVTMSPLVSCSRKGGACWEVADGVELAIIRRIWFWSKELGHDDIMDNRNQSGGEHSVNQDETLNILRGLDYISV